VIAVAAGVILLGVVAGATGSTRPDLSRVLKMSASTLLVVTLIVGAADFDTYTVLVLVALGLSWIGDLALSFDGRSSFVAGLVSFALAHVAYIAAFGSLGQPNWPWFAVGAVVMVVVGIGVLRWLGPHRPDELAGPITAYVVIISVMVATAFGTIGSGASGVVPIAAVLFAGSDILVARNQFVAPVTVNRVIGLPMYFLAQALFVASVL
jgi:uncharacterized membrane protein YhhN